MLYTKETKSRTRIWSLLLCLCMVLSCLPITVFAETDGGASSSSVSTGTTSTGGSTTETGTTGSSATDTGTTGTGTTDTTESGATGSSATDSTAGTTDSTAGTAYGQVTGSCSCGGTYTNGICSNADCTDPYQEPSTDESGVYQIANAGNLYWFAKHVNDQIGQVNAVNAKLTKNITVNASVLTDGNLPDDTSALRQWTPIGNSDLNAYTGTFDGQGHTISGLYYNGSDKFVGLFGYIAERATIQDVGVIDSCFQVNVYSAYLGGIVGYAETRSGTYLAAYPITISKCSSAALLVSTAGDVCVGGVVGYVFSGEETAVTIQNCANTGKITASSASDTVYCGGVIGLVSTLAGSVTIQNCANTGKITATSASGSVHCGGVAGYASADNPGTVTLSNCYYLSTVAGNAIGWQYGSITAPTDASKTADAFASGEVAYLLNGSTSEGTLVWKQTIGTDKTPNFTSTQIVYTYTNCVGATSYTNDSTQESGAHGNHENGLCAVCGGDYEEPSTDANGVYQISNAGNLFWFAAKVNSGETSVNAKLTADIDLENRAWTAIGTAEKPYTGTFDGGNFTISNFSLTVTEGNNQGFFGAVSGGTVKNFTIRGEINITATIDVSDVSNVQSISNVGGVVGYATNKAVIENITSRVYIADSHTPITYTAANGTEQSICVSGIGGIVGYMDGSTIRNCTYDGTITSVCGASIAGIVGNASNSSAIAHCINKGNVTAENNSAHIGGIAGDVQTGTTVSYCLNFGSVISSGGDCIGGIVAYANQNVKIEYCGNIGKVTCTADGNGFIGGILGYVNNSNFKGISNCFNYGTIVTNEGKTAHAGAILGYNRNSGSVYSNNYYLDTSCTKAVSDNAISDVYSMTADQFSSGEVAYKLGGSKDAGAWKQTLGEGGDSYPNFTGKDVYYGYANCTTTEQSYINESYTTQGHHYDNGFCTRCGDYEAPTLVDGYYEIDNAGKLYWFAAKVNDRNFSINAKLTADITVNPGKFDADGNYTVDGVSVTPRNWTPIVIPAKGDPAYTGTFDGNNKYISGLYVNADDYGIGLFYSVGKDGTVKNVVVKDFYFKGAFSVGGVAGENHGTIANCTSSGTVIGTYYVGGVAGENHGTIANCTSSGTVIGTYYVGGVTGGNSGTVMDCASTCTVSGTDFYVGGVVGENGGNVTNCYNSGTVSGTATDVGGVVGHNAGNGTVTNCYYLNTCASVGIGSGDGEATAKTQDQFTSGEVTYLLNGKSSAEDVVWKQTLNNTSFPGFTGGIVYYGYLSCEEGTLIGYTNIKDVFPTKPDHDYDNGICKVCGKYQPCAGKGTATEPYLIANAGNLYWFEGKVNSGETSANAKLTADITINPGTFDKDGNYTPGAGEAEGTAPRAWTPIGGGENAYIGAFDGTKYDESGENAIGSYVISGLYVYSGSRVGLFGLVGEGGTVKNVTVKDAYIKGGQYVGGVVGENWGATITNCTVSGTVSGSESVGGVVGGNYSGELTNCTNTATVTGTGDNVGGVVGYNNGGDLTGCTNTAKVTGSSNVGGVVGKNDELATLTSCTNSGEVSGTGDNVGGVVGYGVGTVTNCTNTGKITGTGDNVGGLVGYNELGEIKNCYNSGAVSGSNDVGGLVGALPRGTIANCYNTGKVTGSSNVGGIAGKIENGGCWRCCYLTGTANKAVGEGDSDDAYELTAADFKSGAATWLLNDEFAGEDIVWKQTLGTDDYPVFTGGTVYSGYEQCNDTRLYTNDSDEAEKLNPYPHDYYEHEDGICTKCGAYQPCEGKGTAKKPYVITNIGNLYWFAAKVNGGETDIHAELWADITVNPGTFDKDGNYTPGEGEAAGTTPRAWTPIGNYDNGYTGTFDGNGHSISGLYFNNAKDGYVGLFGLVGNGGTVQNVAVKGSYIMGSWDVGGVAGSNSGTITNCSYSGTIIGTDSSVGGVVGSNSGTLMNCYHTGVVSGKEKVGGVAGSNGGTITNCYNTGSVTGTGRVVGGVVGHSHAGSVTSCYNTGLVTGSDKFGSVAGENSATITNCYYLKGTSAAGVGSEFSDDTNVEAMRAADFASGKVTWLLNGKRSEGTTESPLVWKQTLSGEDKQNLPGFDGETVYGGYIKCDEKGKFSNDAADVTGAKQEVSDSHQFNDDGFCTVCDAYQPCAGEGTNDEPYQIANAGNLYWFAEQVNGGKTDIHANLTADITVNKNVLKSDGTLNTGTFHAWTPIGSESNKFTGIFGGQKYDEDQYGMLIIVGNYTISGLYFNDTTKDYVGLFGYVGYGGHVEEVVIKDSYFKGNQYVGGVAGYSEGEISDCYNTGTVSGSSYVGGVAGYNTRWVENCSNSGTVSGASYVGGVVGWNPNPGMVRYCYNTGAVSGTSDIGGVVGCNEDEISDCYNTGTITGTVAGDVTGTADIGGVAGSNSGSISNCYNSGTISGNGAYHIGGVVGHNYEGGSISNCYYLTGCAKDGNDTEQYGIGNATMGSTTADAENVTTGKTKAQFATGEVAWRLNGRDGGVWRQELGKDAYPCFSSQIVYRYTDCQGNDRFSQVPLENGDHYCDADGFCIAKKPDGTLCGAYQPCEGDASGYFIKNIGNLYWFAEQVNSGQPYINGILAADITVNKNVLKAGGTLNGDGSNFRVWTPIGNSSYPYIGIFRSNEKLDENGESLGYYTISGLYVKSTDPYVGLFGYAENAKIFSINVADSYFESSVMGENADAYVGGIVGYAQGEVHITGCTSSGTFIATANGDCAYAYAGGIAGYIHANSNSLLIINCTSSGTVTAKADGISDSGDSDANAYAYAGGIAGYAFASGNVLNITNCTSLGNVTAEAHGDSSADADSFCEAFSGGLVGYAYANANGTLRIECCYNTGAVTATADNGTATRAYSGGLVGHADAAEAALILNIEYCYNTGAVTATADVDSSAYSGGLVGCAYAAADSLTIRNCYYLNTSATATFGDRLGEMTIENAEAKTEKQFASGEVTWLLNGKRSEGTDVDPLVWKQTLGGTNLPGFSGDTVYCNYTDCKNTVYSNTQVSATPLAHNYENNNGFCKVCGAYQPCEQDASGTNLIANAGNLYWFAQLVNSQHKAGDTDLTVSGNAKLTADIIVNANVLKSDGTLNSGDFKAWTPIGSDSNQYAGTFDGNGKTISGLYYNGGDRYVGLFGYIANGASIQNITVTDSYFCSTSTASNVTAYVGGLAGYADAQTYTMTIQNCVFCGTINASGSGSYFSGNVGGLVGYLKATSGTITVKNCSFDGKADASGGNTYAGGLAGKIDVDGTAGKCNMENCHATGNVTASGSNAYAGGLIGYAKATGTTEITNCYATGNITASGLNTYAGGLIGWANAAGKLNVTNCYATSNVTANSSGSDAYAGGLIGYADAAGAITVTNCYYLNTAASSAIGSQSESGVSVTNVASKTAAAFASGEVTWLLNGERSEGTDEDPLVWYQTIDQDDSPRFTGKTVYYDASQTPPYYNEMIVSVTIVWTAMSFSYTKGTWNTDTMTWDGGGWKADAGCGTVTVTNTGELDVTAQFAVTFTDNSLGISVSFMESGTALTDNKLTIAKEAEKTVTVKLTGNEPSAYIETAKTIGQITVILTTE